MSNYIEGLKANDLTTAKVTPIVNNIKTVLNGVVTDVKGLSGQPSSLVLANNGVSANLKSDAIVPIGTIAAIIAKLIRVSPPNILLSYGTRNSYGELDHSLS